MFFPLARLLQSLYSATARETPRRKRRSGPGDGTKAR